MNSQKNSNKKSRFKETVFEILEIFEINIQYVGVVRSKMDVLNRFYDTQYSGAENEIKQKVMLLDTDFFGGMNFAVRDSEENKALAQQLTNEIEEIKELLHKLE